MNEEEIHRNLFAGVNSTPVQSLERRTLENETVAITVMPGTLFHSLTLIHPNPDTDLIVKLCTNLYAAWDRHQKAEPWSTISSVTSPAFCFYSEPPWYRLLGAITRAGVFAGVVFESNSQDDLIALTDHLYNSLFNVHRN
jgi:hypothetical protein